MMDHFKVCYIPGGMGLAHSAWWVCEKVLQSGWYMDVPRKYLQKATYE